MQKPARWRVGAPVRYSTARRVFRWRLASILSILAIIAAPTAAQAHGMTLISSVALTKCIGAHSTNAYSVYNNQGPTDNTWYVRVKIGLGGGSDSEQEAWFNFYMIANGTSSTVAEFNDAGHHWVNQNEYVHGGMLSAHVGSSFDLIVSITNDDDVSQCYIIFAQGAYT
jgi:hypothetical protein